MKLSKLQKIAFTNPWNDDREGRKPPIELLPGGLAVGLSFNL